MRQKLNLKKGLSQFVLVPLLLVAVIGNANATKIQEIVSPGGIKAWFVQENSIPILNMEVIWKGGSGVVAPEKAGLAELMASTMDEGAAELDSKAFQGKLADLSISVSFSAGKDTYRGRLKTLSANNEQAFDLFSKAITDPRFDSDPVERIRGQLMASLNRNLSNPRSLAGKAWFEAAFKGHPYALSTEGNLETMGSITVEDLKAFKEQQIVKENMVISVIGDITPEKLGEMLDKTFGALPEQSDLGEVADIDQLNGPSLQVIPMEIPQSIIVFGGDGVKRDDPDYYAAYVLNYILGGGGFESRLNAEIREKRGLVYSIYTYLSPFEAAGVQLGGLGTSDKSTLEALKLIQVELQKLRNEGVTEEELIAAKKYLNGSFALQLSSNANIANIMASMQFSQLPIDYLEHRTDLIDAVTLADLKRVAQKLMDPDKLIITIVGKSEYKSAWEEGLKNFR